MDYKTNNGVGLRVCMKRRDLEFTLIFYDEKEYKLIFMKGLLPDKFSSFHYFYGMSVFKV